MGYVELYIPGVYSRNRFIDLMTEGGVKHISLDELMLTFACVYISHITKASTLGVNSGNALLFTADDIDALSMVPPDARYQYILTYPDYVQTQLSS